jgi:hypothetical protein
MTTNSPTVRGLANPATFDRFQKWMRKNCIDAERLNSIDLSAEFGKDLSYNEAIEFAVHKFPSLWSQEYLKEYDSRPKQIIFVKELVKKIGDGLIQVTYRKSPKIGTYYVIENRFKQNSSSAKLLIRFYQTEKVDAYKLNDDEAMLAGVESASKIRLMFEKWYGSPIPTLYRNWFKTVQGA